MEKKRAIEAEKMKECTFRPKLSAGTRARSVKSSYSRHNYASKLREDQARREAEREALRKMQEFEQLKECTFRPDTSKAKRSLEKVPAGSLETMVKGMQGVYRTKDLAEKKKRDLAEREQEVFGFAERYDERKKKNQTHTVPQPFKLSKVSIALTLRSLGSTDKT